MATGLELEKRITFKVVTGDGLEWYPDKIQKGGASMNPNTAGYDKPNVEGSEVRRNSGSSALIDLIFQMDAEKTAPFLESCKNPEKWVVTHPVYGKFDCLPTSIDVNSGAVEGHVWTVKVWKTIGSTYPIREINTKTDVADKSDITLELSLVNMDTISASDKDIIGDYLTSLNRVYSSVLDSNVKAAIDDALATTLDVTSTAADVTKATEKVVLLPRDISLQISDNVDLIRNQYAKLSNAVVNSFEMCKFYEASAAQIIALISEIIVNPTKASTSVGIETDNTLEDDDSDLDEDYLLRSDILTIAEETKDFYDLIVSDIDSLVDLGLEDENGSAFVPDEDLYSAAKLTVSAAIAGLNDIAFSAKKDTVYITEKDTTIEWLAYELYGSASDENINLIIDANDLFGINTIENTWRNMIVPMNKSITYYS